MDTVGIRELRNHLSEYLRRVQVDRRSVSVTDRGEVVAMLVPAADATGREPAPSLADRVRRHGGRLPTSTAPLPEVGAAAQVPGLDVLALLDELRGSR